MLTDIEIAQGAELISAKESAVKLNIAESDISMYGEKIEKVSNYLVENKFCSAEPTVNQGSSFSQINVLIPKEHFPEMLDGIRALGASSIIRSDVKQYVI